MSILDDYGAQADKAMGGNNDEAIGRADGPDPNTPPPASTEAMFYGLAGQVGKTAATHTEVNPVAATAAFLTYLSAQIGRDAYLSVGNTFHHANVFTCHVGRSERGRKGDAVSLTHRIRSRVEEVHSRRAQKSSATPDRVECCDGKTLRTIKT